ncbi:HTH-type transcriptional repressor NicS [Pseudovibrio sp. W64]|uniref:TetR/AcrR family transcriptional regulator n=1 Tax=unclassified Pseudovibrio TaxID=2627060 RepID=UPI0007AE4C14|nr:MULTISPECIES: TetR/AcrR family transcriptional regulator [unclassified Pseudovibrio]KZK77486.1 HTH-type transcriptional repressor NicS [Pseudovibrio sp. W64]KZK96287.1 HTH-type transcriptional repressor NicS [Pseudovibrio sp. Ad46]
MKQTNPVRTSKRGNSRSDILKAALLEFIDRGVDGVRMEHVADRAGYNKALVYKHFGSKERLFEAVLTAQFQEREQTRSSISGDLSEMLMGWSQANKGDADFFKLLMREALDFEGDCPVHADQRKAYYTQQIAVLADLQKEGRLPTTLEPHYLFLALLGTLSIPQLLPQVAELVVGDAPGGEEFEQGLAVFLKAFGEVLSPK